MGIPLDAPLEIRFAPCLHEQVTIGILIIEVACLIRGTPAKQQTDHAIVSKFRHVIGRVGPEEVLLSDMCGAFMGFFLLTCEGPSQGSARCGRSFKGWPEKM